MQKPPRLAATEYLKNKTLLAEIRASKNSYCVYADDDAANYSEIIEVEFGASIADALSALTVEPNTVIRVHTTEHVPIDPAKKQTKRDPHGLTRTNFPPFQHWRYQDQEWTCVGKSHWAGGLHNGWFETQHGRLTDNLVMGLLKLVTRYARHPSWRGYSYNDDMQGAAIEHLLSVALAFNEAKGDNPFAYLTTITTNAFKKVLAKEKRATDIRDELLISAGMPPSMGRQIRDAENPPPLPSQRRKPGRPKKPVSNTKTALKA